MANTITSPNMNLIIPVTGVDPGPDWANNLNASLLVIDSHNHAAGSGVQITPSGLNINSDLTFLVNNATQLRSVRFNSQGSPLALGTDVGCIYESGVDLYYNDGNANQIRITQSGAIAGTPGSITGLVAPASATYSPPSQTFIWQSNVNTPANLDAASVILRNLTANSKGLTLQPPAAMGSNYSLVLPSLPGSTSFLSVDTSGNITSTPSQTNGLTISMMAIKTSGTSVSAGNVAIAGSSGAFSTSSASPVSVTNQSITLVTIGRPVQVMLQPSVTTGSDANTKLLCHCDGTNGSTVFTDNSSSVHTLTASGTAAVSTGTVEFGTGSAALASSTSGSYVSSAGSSDWAFGTGDFTVEFWMYSAGNGTTWANASGCIGTIVNGASNTHQWSIGYRANGVGFFRGDQAISEGGTNPSANVWHAIAVTRSSGTLRVFLDGTIQSSVSDSSNYSDASVALKIGYDGYNNAGPQGFIDEVRISNIARYTANYVPATQPFGNGALTSYIGASALNSNAQAVFTLQRDGTTIGQYNVGFYGLSTSFSISSPPGCIQALDIVTAGTHTYTLQAQVNGVSPSAIVQASQLVAYET